MTTNVYRTYDQLDVRQKLAPLADAAKYDASCGSSGTAKRSSAGGTRIGSTEGRGIRHADKQAEYARFVADLRMIGARANALAD